MRQGEMGFREQKREREREDTSSVAQGCRYNGRKLKEFLPHGICSPREVESEASCWE